MKNDRYFPLEICFWAGDNLSVMIYQIGGVQLVGIYVLLLYLCAKNDYSKSVVNSMQKPVERYCFALFTDSSSSNSFARLAAIALESVHPVP